MFKKLSAPLKFLPSNLTSRAKPEEETMKTTALALIAIAGTNGACPGAVHSSPEREVTVCITSPVDLDVPFAKIEARRMFAKIGVEIDWRSLGTSCPARALVVSLETQEPDRFFPHAFGYAQPYEGTHIHVFYDRVQKAVGPSRVRYLLAHVLAHEITHMLEGTVRHSETGIMKAHWDVEEYTDLHWKPLEFAPEDIDLIYLGLASRARTVALETPRNGGRIGIDTRALEAN
jgi:hypothetical protein